MSKHGRFYEKLSSESSENSQSLLLQPDDNAFSVTKVTVRRGFAIIAKTPKLLLLMVVPFATMMLVIIFGGVLLSRTWKPTLTQITISTRIPPDFCGFSPAEAKAAGCKFEANNFAWQHPDCYDEEQEEDWRHGPWSSDLEFWREHGDDWTGVDHISNEEAFSGMIDTVWVNTLQHRRHCLHVWRKYVLAANAMKPMDSWTTDPHHVDHCVTLLRDFNNSAPDEKVSSKLSLKYPSCEFGPVAITITPMGWTNEQKRLHQP